MLRRALVLAAVCASFSNAQPTFPVNAIQNLKWRMIGPFRAGRTKSAAGVPTQPNVFYMAPSNGGVWKTTDYGRTWNPIFDDQPSQSVGAIEVSLSSPNVIYVGSGEGLQRPDLSTGDGMWKSTDAGKTWTHIGLGDAQQIPRIAIDPRNPDRVFVAALGHPYGPNAERGIFRSLNGGRTWEKVLYTDENTGGADIVMSPSDPNTLYADMWEARQGPWENGAFNGPGTAMYKTTDGGTTWTKLAGGLPTAADGLGRIGISVAPSNANRLYITATAGAKSGIWRSDDAGATWTRTTDDNRIFGRGDDFAALTVDPRNPDVVYSANVVSWKSTDGGMTWKSVRGAPGGDDYQRFWINPNNPDIQLLVADQGAVITVNGGETWSSWYNQPTAQFYHVTATNMWPYELCGGQQESGSACVKSRGNDGSIGYREFHPVGASEYSYVAPDPLNPDIFYGGTVTRFDRRTGQTQNVSPNAGAGRGGGASGPNLFRGIRTMPILFSPTNKKKLYYSTNVLWETVDGGQHWQRKSPDLTRTTWDVPKSVGKYIGTPAAAPSQRGVIYTIAPSPVDSNTIWVGTDDGLIHVTRDNGKSWKDVTPPAIGPWMKVSIMDASHFDANTAYAAVNTLRLDDLNPHLFRTTDGGKTWTEIVSGIEKGASTNTIKEDPKRRGLLFAGTERTVWFSLDNGDHWHSLRLNLPGTSVRDLVVVNDDVAVGTHGRGFWILDDISTLRQWSERVASRDVVLFDPAVATRVRYSMYTDTPVPPDEPMAANPPDGAVIEYYLKNDVSKVTIEIVGEGIFPRVIRRFSSDDRFDPPQDDGNAPWYWFRPGSAPSNKAGLHRFVWDLHYARPTGQACSLPISATPRQTKCEPEGPWVHPGKYMIRFWVGEKGVGNPQHGAILTVRMDPRVKASAAALKQQYDLSMGLYDAHEASVAAQARISGLRSQLAERRSKASALGAAIDSLDARLVALAGATGGGRGGRGGGGAPASETFGSIASSVLGPLNVLQDADEQPVAAVVAGATERIKAFKAFKALEARWNAIVKTDLVALNARLKAAGAAEVTVSP